MTFRPLLAADPLKYVHPDAHVSALSRLRYPLLVSPKIDGIRVLVRDKVAITRSLKPVRNKHVQSSLGNMFLEGLDGEVTYGEGLDPMTFRMTTTAVMAEEGVNPFTYWVFDIHTSYLSACPFESRLQAAKELVDALNSPFVKVLEHTWVHKLEDLLFMEQQFLEQGFEGLMIRDPNGVYKYGRSTANEGTLLKLKRGQVRNGDAEIIGFKERMQNNNVATVNELGLSERSAHKENMVGRGDLGSLLVRDIDQGLEFSIGIGVGLDDKMRKEIWDNQGSYVGKIVRYEWFAYGNYDIPRFPKFVCFRDKEDLS